MAINGIGETDRPHTRSNPRPRAMEAIAQLARPPETPSAPDPIPDFSFGDLPKTDPDDETSFPEAPNIPQPPDDAGAPMTLSKRTGIEGSDGYGEVRDSQEAHPDELLATEAMALETLALEELALEEPTMNEADLDDLVDTIVLIEATNEGETTEGELEPELNEASFNLMHARFQSALDAGAHTITEDQPGDLLDMLA